MSRRRSPIVVRWTNPKHRLDNTPLRDLPTVKVHRREDSAECSLQRPGGDQDVEQGQGGGGAAVGAGAAACFWRQRTGRSGSKARPGRTCSA